ncbi:tyrosine-type recombinase/integrase [Franconibacter pulveris 1160]|uniref:tyrosine-type recombinase/integrase n=1 Tax=Franconibacter pulveris TaxID=435910 RepID=UPI0004668BAF|nr:site-specific integrase [Franconibacter pulveris]
MVKQTYPTGVENHGGTLRIWFIYKGKRVRESLGVVDTPKNRRVAGELRASVCFAIKTGRFDYAEQFPDSPNLDKFGVSKKEITVGALAAKWLDLKRMEITANAMSRYTSIARNVVPMLGERKLASAITPETVLLLRKELLTGYQILKVGHKTPVKGRSVPTVNAYMAMMSGMFRFAADSGYIETNPFSGVAPLRKAKPQPDPLTREEFYRLIEACPSQQTRNFWSLAVYTGMRHGELCALAWEDIDLKAGTLKVRRNHTLMKEFTLPKTQAGTDRVIHLIQPALDILKNQAAMTRLGKQYQVEVKLREYGRTTVHPCTFVFNPSLTAVNRLAGHHYAVGSVNQIWEAAMRRAGLRYRKAYQSRHTYACWSLAAGANPNFIASQMGHANAQMVYQVYGSWMAENNTEQVAMLNQKLSDYAPPMPHAIGSD